MPRVKTGGGRRKETLRWLRKDCPHEYRVSGWRDLPEQIPIETGIVERIR